MLDANSFLFPDTECLAFYSNVINFSDNYDDDDDETSAS